MKGFMNMFTNDQFKSLLIKTLERKSSSNYYEGGNEIVSKMKISEVTLDETDDFTYLLIIKDIKRAGIRFAHILK